MTTHDELSKDDWHHGYSAGALLRLVALALRECASYVNQAWEQDECFRTLVSTLADTVEWRASTLHWSAYDVVSEVCQGLLFTFNSLYGGGSLTARADYLICRLAYQQPDWIETMKRRKHWLALVQDDEEVQCQGGSSAEPQK